MFIVEKPLSKGGLANTTNAHDCCNFNAASETCCACLVMQMDLIRTYIGPVRCAGAGGCCWSGVREKHCWLAGGGRLLLEWCERKTLLAGWRLLEQTNFYINRSLFYVCSISYISKYVRTKSYIHKFLFFHGCTAKS